MPVGRRLTTLLVVLALVAFPAVALRAFCVGKSCDTGEATASAPVPFCPLPAGLRDHISAGFRQGRSPDVMAVTPAQGPAVRTRTSAAAAVPWPSTGAADLRVPIAFFGDGLTGTDPADGTGLDQIAPTLSQAIGFARTHPEVRSGAVAPGVARPGGEPRPRAGLVVQIAWKGVGTPDLEARPDAWPFLGSMLERGGGTLEGTTGSLPLDPSATLTTIGTGGLPSQHGIIGTTVRDDEGRVVEAWGTGAPGSVIATLADDLDRAEDQEALVAGVLSARSDRGILGDGWYLDERDRDQVVVTDSPLRAVEGILGELGSRGGVLAVVLRDSIAGMDRTTRAIVRAVQTRAGAGTFVVTATGSLRGPRGIPAAEIAGRLDASVASEVIEADAAGGLFLDRSVALGSAVTTADVVDAMHGVRMPGGRPMFAEAFPSFAVAFSRYC